MSILDEIAAKHAKVAAWLTDNALDGVLLTRRCNFSWYTSGAHNHVPTACDVGVVTLLVTGDGAVALTNNIEAERLRGEDLVGRGIDVIDVPWHDAPARAAAVVKAIAGRNVAADAPVPGVDAPALPTSFNKLRWTMSDAEISRYRQLAIDVAASVEQVAQGLEPGTSEQGAAGLLEAILSQRGCLSWVCLAAGESRVAKYRHPLPTAAVISKYGLFVTCAERDGLIVACSRLVYFGKLPKDLAAKHRAVVTVDAALIDATRPGATLGDILDAGIRMYDEVGFADQWQFHHQGGSAGYLPREIIATPGDPTVALANQPFAWNPSITGTKSEDTVLCTDGGAGAPILSLTDDWPTFDVEINGTVYPRPDILVR